MNFLDIITGILLVFGLFRGLKNGFFIELASLLALVVGLYGAIHFSYATADYIAQYVDWNERYITITAFLITFLGIMILIHLAGRFFTFLADIVLLGFFNRIAGGTFGMLKFAVVLGTLLVFFEKHTHSWTLFSEDAQEASLLYKPLQGLGNLVFHYIPEMEAAPEEKEDAQKEAVDEDTDDI